MIDFLLLGVLLPLLVADMASTMYIMNRGGYEANGLLARVMIFLGRNETLLVVKIIVFAACTKWPHWLALGVAISAHLVVVVHNLGQVRKIRERRRATGGD